jgi:hypothetical protein
MQQTQNVTPEKTMDLIKKSIKKIEAESLTEETSVAVWNKIERLEKLGLKSQARILEQEIVLRQKLNKLKEWDYNILTHSSIEKYDGSTSMGLKNVVKIDSVEKYVGIDNSTAAKDKIIPDVVLDKFQEAKDRCLFDSFAILWVEKIKNDPLLLGQIDGCSDYFFIAEWGDDIKFEDIANENNIHVKE